MAEIVRHVAQSPPQLLSHRTTIRSTSQDPHIVPANSRGKTDSHLIQEAPHAQRKSRKSVAFIDDTKIMDENGMVSDGQPVTDDRSTAEHHSASGLIRTDKGKRITLIIPTETEDKSVDEITDMFAGLAKKKKKPSKTKTEDVTEETSTPAVGADGEFDASTLKKKKKKSTKPKTDESFEAKLASAGVEEGDAAADGEDPEPQAQSGDMNVGTGIWQHSNATPISYPLLLNRFFNLLNQYNPDILSSGSKSYKIPPPQCLREGNKKTIFANIAEIATRMKRNDEHVTQFLFAELGTSGSVDGSKRLVIKGRFQQKQIENVLRRYIGVYYPNHLPGFSPSMC